MVCVFNLMVHISRCFCLQQVHETSLIIQKKNQPVRVTLPFGNNRCLWHVKAFEADTITHSSNIYSTVFISRSLAQQLYLSSLHSLYSHQMYSNENHHHHHQYKGRCCDVDVDKCMDMNYYCMTVSAVGLQYNKHHHDV